MIDVLAACPLVVRLFAGFPLPTMEEDPVAHYILVCFVPMIRLLKMVRRFQKLQLLLQPHF